MENLQLTLNCSIAIPTLIKGMLLYDSSYISLTVLLYFVSIIRFGTHVSGVSAINRKLKINNTSPNGLYIICYSQPSFIEILILLPEHIQGDFFILQDSLEIV